LPHDLTPQDGHESPISQISDSGRYNTGKPAFPDLPANQTCLGFGEIDAIDPIRT